MWFQRLPSERLLRARPVDGPFAVTLSEGNHDRIYDLNRDAKRQGLERGMGLADARAYVPDLITRPADIDADRRFLTTLARWATRYTPMPGSMVRTGWCSISPAQLTFSAARKRCWRT
nr:hypothetical protein [Marinicella sp. W31]MDC2878858.1 hypothetical protein [Marinicella sp. W31]